VLTGVNELLRLDYSHTVLTAVNELLPLLSTFIDLFSSTPTHTVNRQFRVS